LLIFIYKNKKRVEIMAYLPLNNTNFEVGDNVLCIENRFAKIFDYKSGFRAFGEETVPFLSLKEDYEIVTKDSRRRKVGIVTDDGVVRQVPYYRMGVEEKED